MTFPSEGDEMDEAKDLFQRLRTQIPTQRHRHTHTVKQSQTPTHTNKTHTQTHTHIHTNPHTIKHNSNSDINTFARNIRTHSLGHIHRQTDPKTSRQKAHRHTRPHVYTRGRCKIKFRTNHGSFRKYKSS